MISLVTPPVACSSRLRRLASRGRITPPRSCSAYARGQGAEWQGFIAHHSYVITAFCRPRTARAIVGRGDRGQGTSFANTLQDRAGAGAAERPLAARRQMEHP